MSAKPPISLLSADVVARTETGRSSADSGEYSPINGAERMIADAVLLAIRLRGQEADDDALVAFLDALRDGSSPLIAGGVS